MSKADAGNLVALAIDRQPLLEEVAVEFGMELQRERPTEQERL